MFGYKNATNGLNNNKWYIWVLGDCKCHTNIRRLIECQNSKVFMGTIPLAILFNEIIL